MIAYLTILTVLSAIFIYFAVKEDRNDPITRQVILKRRFEKLLEKTTNEEQDLYMRIFEKITYTHASSYKVSYIGHEISEVKIGWLNIELVKTTKKYDCIRLTIQGLEGRDVDVYPPVNQFDLYDILAELVVYKIYFYQKELEEDRRKEVSAKHQKDIRKALQAVKSHYGFGCSL